MVAIHELIIQIGATRLRERLAAELTKVAGQQTP